MKFVVDTTSKLSGRLGNLTHPKAGKTFRTPLLIQTTKSGSIPYISKDIFRLITDESPLLQISLATCEHMEEALEFHKIGIASFAGHNDTCTFVCLKDPCEIASSGFNEKDIVPLFTRRGKATITVDRYMHLMEIFRPDMYHTLCDSDTNNKSAKKRIIKSVDRTENFFQGCLELHKKSDILKESLLFAPIVGGYSKEARTKSINTISSVQEVGGYIIDGLHTNGDNACKINLEELKDIVLHCVNQLENNKPKMVIGAYNPLMILELIQIGVDIFDTSYVYIATSNFQALTFNFFICRKNQSDKFSLELGKEGYQEDFNPVLKGCGCLTCKKHTRAYIHHLIKTKELLGSILIMIHNIHHFISFFDMIRKSIIDDQIPELKALIQNQIKDADQKK